jgi:hypothetical protein
MRAKETHKKQRNKKYRLELSSTSVLFWGFSLLFLLAWVFVLGIFVGRGLLPDPSRPLSGLKNRISKWQDLLVDKNPPEVDLGKREEKDTEFLSFKTLATKKEVTAEPPPSPPKKREVPVQAPRQGSPPELMGEYTVQVASLESETRARKVVQELTRKGYPAYLYKASLNGKTRYRVRCGRFHSAGDARAFSHELEQREKVKGFISKVED